MENENRLQKLRSFFSSLRLSHRFLSMLVIVGIAFAVPATLYLNQRSQDIRQHASTNGSITFLDTTTNQPITETTDPNIKLQISLPDDWQLPPQQIPASNAAPPSSRLNIIPQVNAQTTTPTTTQQTTTTPFPPTSTTTPSEIPTTTITPSATTTPNPSGNPSPTTTQKHILRSIVIWNDRVNGDGDPEREIREQNLTTALANPIPWKLDSLAPAETSKAETIKMQFVDSNGASLGLSEQITLKAPGTISPTAAVSPSVLPSGTSPSPSPSTSAVSPTPSGSLTPGPSGTVTPTVASPPLGGTTLSLTIQLQGIGKQASKGAQARWNPNPTTIDRDLTVYLYRPNQDTTDATITPIFVTRPNAIEYNKDTGLFTTKMPFDLGANFVPGDYEVLITSPRYLRKRIPAIQTLHAGSNQVTQQISLIVGDTNADNKVDTLDYETYRTCIDKQTAQCIAKTDFNDNGKVDAISPVPDFSDFTLLQQSFTTQTGD